MKVVAKDSSDRHATAGPGAQLNTLGRARYDPINKRMGCERGVEHAVRGVRWHRERRWVHGSAWASSAGHAHRAAMAAAAQRGRGLSLHAPSIPAGCGERRGPTALGKNRSRLVCRRSEGPWSGSGGVRLGQAVFWVRLGRQVGADSRLLVMPADRQEQLFTHSP